MGRCPAFTVLLSMGGPLLLLSGGIPPPQLNGTAYGAGLEEWDHFEACWPDGKPRQNWLHRCPATCKMARLPQQGKGQATGLYLPSGWISGERNRESHHSDEVIAAAELTIFFATFHLTSQVTS